MQSFKENWCAFKNDKEFVKFASAEINEEHN